MTILLSDIRLALRQMRLAPVFTIIVMLTLGLGIGATTAIFSLIHAVMLKSLPVADPSSLYRIGTGKSCCYLDTPQLRRGNGESSPTPFTSASRIQYHSSIRLPPSGVSRIFLVSGTKLRTRRLRAFLGEYVSDNYFETFGLKPFAARLFVDSDDLCNAAPVAVMSYVHGNRSLTATSRLSVQSLPSKDSHSRSSALHRPFFLGYPQQHSSLLVDSSANRVPAR